MYYDCKEKLWNANVSKNVSGQLQLKTQANSLNEKIYLYLQIIK